MSSIIVNSEQHNDVHDKHVLSKDLFGFWIYILTDCVLFATLFITFIVLSARYEPYDFNMSTVLAETFILLTSSFTFGLAIIRLHQKNLNSLFLWMFITFVLGASFIFLELKEFVSLINEGNSFTTNGYFSSFFVLVATHGLHVSVGLLWILVLFLQLKIHGITAITKKKLLLLSLFWHFLDIVWIFVFSIVYLIGGL